MIARIRHLADKLPWGGSRSAPARAYLNGRPHQQHLSGGRPRLGLALSSGGAKGLAHIGVIQVLEENGIEIDVVAGASMGAYVGSLWAAGYSGVELEALAGEMRTKRDLLRLIDPVFPPRQGLLRGYKVKAHLAKSLRGRRFEDLEKEFHVVATNLVTLQRRVFSEGDVATAVHASIAVPGVCVPVEIDGELYSDGGISEPLPVSVLRSCEVDHVIAVSALPSPKELAACRVDYFHDEPERNLLRRLGRCVNRQFNLFAKGNMIDILRSSAYGSQTRLAHRLGADADVFLEATLCEGRWHDYSGFERYIRLGRECAEAHIEEIRNLTLSWAA
ncbi:MAG: patatin-like phospholipase family protein [Verrucomicrobiales bacterium]